MAGVLEELDSKLASTFQIKNKPMTSGDEVDKLELLSSLLRLYDESWKIEGTRVVFGQQSKSAERSHQLKRTQDQKRLRGFLRLADLGHLAVEGEPLVGKKFSRLISGVVSKLETRYGSALPTKVRNMTTGGGHSKRGKENLATSPQPPPSPVPRVPLLEVNSVVEKVCIPMGKQLARTPPKESEVLQEPEHKSEEEEQECTTQSKRVSSFYSPSPSDTGKAGLRIKRRNQMREKVKVSPSEFDLSLVPSAGVQLPRTPDLPRHLETPSPPPQPSPQAPGDHSLPLPPPPGLRASSSAIVNPISQHVNSVLKASSEQLQLNSECPPWVSDCPSPASPPLPPPPPDLVPQPSTLSSINHDLQAPAMQRPVTPDPPDSYVPSSNSTTPHISNLLATHSIPTGRQLAATPATGGNAESRCSLPEPSGKYELPSSLAAVAIPTEEELEAERKRRVDDQEKRRVLLAKELEKNLKEQKMKEEAEERKRKVAEEKKRKLEAEQEERRKLEEGRKELLEKEKLLADKERQMEEEVARQKAQILQEKKKLLVENEKALAEEVAKKLAEEKEKILAEKKLMEKEALRQREEAELEKARLAEERRELLRWREEKQRLEEWEENKRREKLVKLQKDKGETEAAPVSERGPHSTDSNIEKASKSISRKSGDKEAADNGEEGSLDHLAGGNKHGPEDVVANALEVQDMGLPEDSLELPRQPLLTIHSEPQLKLTKHAGVEPSQNEQSQDPNLFNQSRSPIKRGAVVEQCKALDKGNRNTGHEVGHEEENERRGNLQKVCETKSPTGVTAVPGILEEASVKMMASMENGVVATSKKENVVSKKVEGEETAPSKKIKAHSPKETPVKVNNSSSRARRRKCDAEFGKVDDNQGGAPEVPIVPIEKALGINDENAETIVEDGDEVEEVEVKKVKTKRIIRIGRGPTKSRRRKEEKAETDSLKQNLKTSDTVEPSATGLCRSSRSKQVSPGEQDQDQESVEHRRRSKRGSNVLVEQAPPAHRDGESLLNVERAVVDDQREVKKGEKQRKKRESIQDKAEDDGVQENSRVVKKSQRRNNISIEDTPTPYKKVKAKTSKNLSKAKAMNLKETEDAISRQVEGSTEIKKASPISKKPRGSEVRKERVGKVRQEHENGGDENEVVRESSVVGEGRGVRKKKAGNEVPELSSPQKKLRGVRGKKEQDPFEDSSTDKNALLHVKKPHKKSVSQEFSTSVIKETVTESGLLKVQLQESAKTLKQNLKGGLISGRNDGKESRVLESSMLTKLAERKRRSEAMTAADWQETLERAKNKGRADRKSPQKEHSSFEVKLAARKHKVEAMAKREEDRLASELFVGVEGNADAAENGFASEDLSVISCMESPTKRLQVPMRTRSRKGSKQPKLGSVEVEASGLYHSAMEEQEITPDNNAMGIEGMAVGKTNEGAKSTRPKRQCAKRFESFLGVDSNSPSANFQNLKGRKSKVMAAPKAMPQLISSDEPGPPLATSTTSKQDKVLLTTMRDELYCTPSSRIVNIEYETPMEHKGVFSTTVCDEQFVTPHEEQTSRRSVRPRKK